MIAFIGSVFSPYYAAARRRGPSDPLDHVNINAILYTPRGKYWAMTERGRGALFRSSDRLAIGPSALFFEKGRLVISIEEWTVPLPRRLSGRIVIDTGALATTRFALDDAGRHHWQPLAPAARASVTFDRPGLAWQGKAYVDMNTGSVPLEDDFRSWTWSREDAGATTRILYDVEQRSGGPRSLALDCRDDGSVERFAPAPRAALPITGWRVARSTRATPQAPARVVKTLEDTPFYSRSLLAVGSGSGETRAMHESVDFDRFRSRWVQTLLPFKMPRRSG